MFLVFPLLFIAVVKGLFLRFISERRVHERTKELGQEKISMKKDDFKCWMKHNTCYHAFSYLNVVIDFSL